MISSLWLKIKNFFSNTRKRSLFLRSLGLSVLVLAIAAGVFIATKPKIIEKSKAAERVLIPVKSSTPAEFAPGEILIKFKKGTKLNLSSKAVSSDRTGGKVNVSVNDYDVNSLPKLIRSAQSYIKYINKVIPDTQPVNTRIKLLEGITKETQNKEEIAEEIRMLKQVKSQTGSDFSNIYKIVLKSPKELTSAVSKDNKILAYTHKVDGVEVLEAIPSDDKLYTLQKIEELKRDPQVEYAVPNYVMKALLTPNDPLFNHELLWGIRKIDSTQAWDKTTGNDQIVVAVIDTGIDYTHEDIRENVWINWAEVSKPKSQIIDVNGNGVIDCEDLFDPKNKGIQDGKDNDQNGYYDDFCGWNFLDSTNKPLDDHGHGTHVSGTIGAVTNNNRGVAGVNWKVKIMAAKFLNSSGTGYLSGAIEALKYAADTGARVSSNSWGASSPPIPVLNEAIDYEYAKGMVIVAAAGNESHDAFKAQPAAYEKVITVSAIDSQDKIASFSNYGEKIDVGAPGVNVLSLRAKGTDMYGDGKHIVNDKYYFASGTSMATPHVSGLAALILARNPNLTNEQVRQVIRIGSNDMGPSGKDDQYGFGRINSNLAINFLDSNPNVLTPQITSPENNSVFSADTITVKGSLGGKNVKSYKIEIGKNQSWTKVAESNQIPANDVLGVINWKSLGVSPGPYNIRLVVTDTKGNNYESEVYAIEMDTDIVTGWPKDIDPSSHLSILGPGGSPAFGDVDGDGKKELVASDDTKLYVFRKNGTLLPGFPFEYKSPNPTFVWPQWTWKAKLNVVDIDKDGKDEIITYWALDAVTNDYMTYFIVVIRGDGTIQPGWPYAMQDWGMNNYIPAVGDINNDGKNELVFYTCDWYRFGSSSYSGEIYLHVVDVNNKELSGFPKYIDKTVSGGTYTFEGLTGPSLADVNGDGKLEIGFNVLNKVYLLDNNGNNLPNWPIINSDGYGNARSGVTYADLDGDGKLEIISTPDITYTGPYTNSDSQTYAFKVDGSVYPGFPRKDSLRSLMTDYGWPVINSAANTGGSGRDELYYSKHSSKSNPSSPENNYYPPTISDIDGDGQLEYILGSRTWGSDYIQFQDNTEHAITIMKQDGITKYWDRTDGRGFNNQLLVIGTFVIADMDGNGKMEIAGGRRGKLYLYEIPTLPGKTAKYEWPMQGHDPQFSGRLVTSGIVPTPTSKPTPTVIPTVTPTSKPTATPTSKPSPTVVPTVTPTSKPTVTPTSKPAPTKTPTPIPGSLPDLVITEMTRSDGYYHVTYCNQGTGVSKEGNWTAIQLVNKVTDKSLEYDLYVLQPSRCSNLQFDCNDVRIGDTCNKSLTMEVILDPRDRITESNENNNTYTKSF